MLEMFDAPFRILGFAREQHRRDKSAGRRAGVNFRVERFASRYGGVAAHQRFQYADFECSVRSATGECDGLYHLASCYFKLKYAENHRQTQADRAGSPRGRVRYARRAISALSAGFRDRKST